MHWLTESPGLITGVGIFLIFCLVGLFFYSPNKKLVPLLGIAFLLAVVPLLIDALVETEKEQLQRTVREMARHVRHNDVDRLLRYVHPEARGTRFQIEHELPNYTFSACNVSGFKSIEFDEHDQGRARVRFTVFVKVNAPNFNHNGPAYRNVRLDFVNEGPNVNTGKNMWLVTGFRHYPY